MAGGLSQIVPKLTLQNMWGQLHSGDSAHRFRDCKHRGGRAVGTQVAAADA
jgi:hypothetical protein